MELRQLKYFVAVAEELHFRRAAERCYVAQPAISEQIRKLEQEVGAKLFERSQRSVSLTDAGSAMLDEARRVLQQTETARAAARAAGDRPTARLRIGYAPAALLPGVAHALQRLAASAPRVQTSLEPGSPVWLVDAVRSGWLDAAVLPLPATADGLRVTHLAGQRVVAALRAGHPHAASPTIDLGRLAPEQIMLMPRDANRPLYDAVLALCQSAGVSPTLIELPPDDLEHALLAVASGRDIALLPESFAERYTAPGVRFLPIEGPQPRIATGVITRREQDQLPTATFLRALTSTAAASEPGPRAAPPVRVAA